MTEENNDYQIRRVMISDLAALKILLGYLHDLDPWQEEQDVAAEVTLLRISQDLGRHLLVAEQDGSLIGTIDLTLINGLTRGLMRFGVIENLVVAPDHRQQGVGRALLEEALSIAERENCYKVELVSSSQREAAQSLYKEAGFNASVFGYRKYFTDPNLSK
jgi:ribosomal protein S18 acetylase RimI-like enzyme